MTHALSGTGSPHQPGTRFASADCAVWTVLGRSCSGARPDDQSGRKYFHAGNAERRGSRSAALAGPGFDSYSRTNDLQDVVEIDRRTGEYEDAGRHFRFTGTRATCQLEVAVQVPSIGFSWTSDPPNTSKCDVAVFGEEVNGRYYDS